MESNLGLSITAEKTILLLVRILRVYLKEVKHSDILVNNFNGIIDQHFVKGSGISLPNFFIFWDLKACRMGECLSDLKVLGAKYPNR